MSRRQPGRRKATLGVDPLEGRSLMALVSMPAVLPVRNVAAGVGSFTVLLVSDEIPARSLLSHPQGPMTLTVRDGGETRTLGPPVNEALIDVNHDGLRDLVARFRYRDLKGLAPGTVTVTVTDGTTSEVGTWMIASPRVGRPGKGR